ncbi:MAG: hypothetical protein J5449_04450 [Oscillospiraceae bacterium]|nr:hypothetical protein [Oscillospiraceae bacterium]
MKKWYRLDTAALIFPAISQRDWCNVFRLSAGLTEEVEPEILQRAVDDLAPRFPSFFVTLHKGFFWYYLEQNRERVNVRADYAYPLTFMGKSELRRSCLRVLYFKNRIAVEFFHSITDGHGGIVFLCTLVARYLELKYGVDIPKGDMVRDLSQAPTKAELEDSFLHNAAEVAAGRKETTAYHMYGTPEADGFRHLTTGVVSSRALLDAAHGYKVSVTAFLAAVMARCIIEMQALELPLRRRRPVKITVAIDLRRFFKSDTLRNFVLVLNPGVDPRYGDYTLAELCSTIYHQICAGATRQNMAAMIAANVQPQKHVALRLAPLMVKNLVMDMVYRQSGESGGSLNVSNLGAVKLPAEMAPYVERLEFIIGPQRSYPNNCSLISCGEKTYINMIRNTRESELERRFFSSLVELGIAVDIESNTN